MFEKISDQLKTRASKIKVIGFDVDGVFTDGSLYINEEGESFKKFSALDGLGVKLAEQFGIQVVIISARESVAVHKRFAHLGIREVHTGAKDKLAKAQELADKLGFSIEEEFAYIGDDSPDVAVLEKAALSACPPNAHYSVKSLIHYITEKAGGSGAAREFVDLILYCQGKIPG